MEWVRARFRVVGLQDGDSREAIEPGELTDLYRRYLPMVRGRARRVTGSESAAQDLAQEAFIKLIEHRRASGREQNTAAFLYRIVTNLALNRLRDEKRHREILALEQSREGHREGTSGSELDDRLLLRAVLAAAPADEAEIAGYYYLDGLDHAEIAELLGLGRRTVGRRLERFHRRAQELLREK